MVKERSPYYAEYVAVGTAISLFIVAVFLYRITIISSSNYAKIIVVFGFTIIVLTSLLVRESLSTYKVAYTLAGKMTEELVSHSGELFYELYRNSPVPYVLINMRGMIESTNMSAVRLFGTHEGALDGTNFFSYIEDVDPQKTQLIPEYFTHGKFINDAEVTLRTSKDLTKWVMLSIFSYRDAQGVSKGLVTLVDITKQKMVDKAKTEFVSLASHQLRTPIASIRWNVELFEGIPNTEFNDVQKQYLKKISDGLARMDALVTDFLSVSKLELGTLKPQYETFNLTKFLGGLYEEFRLHAEKKGVRFESNWLEQYGNITSDTRLLTMSLSNLLSNAIKYTPENGTVRAWITEQNETFDIEVKDSGIGIPGPDQEMLFSKLFRASNAETKGIDGTGLGLYIVKEALRVIGGTIRFESVEGKGSTFFVTIPKR